MKLLHKRLSRLDAEGRAYSLDYITTRAGFVFRDARVLEHDEDTLIITQDQWPTTAINLNDITSARIIEL